MQLDPTSQPKRACCSKRLVKMIPGSSPNWIAVNAVQQTKEISMNTLIRLKKTTPLLFVALALINFGLLTPVKAVDVTDTFYGNQAERHHRQQQHGHRLCGALQQ